jgi:hypothetical protein
LLAPASKALGESCSSVPRSSVVSCRFDVGGGCTALDVRSRGSSSVVRPEHAASAQAHAQAAVMGVKELGFQTILGIVGNPFHATRAGRDGVVRRAMKGDGAGYWFAGAAGTGALGGAVGGAD